VAELPGAGAVERREHTLGMAAPRAARSPLALLASLAALLAGACELKQPPSASDSAAVRAAQARWDSAAAATLAAQRAAQRGAATPVPAGAAPPKVAVPDVTAPGGAAAAAAVESVAAGGDVGREVSREIEPVPVEPPDTSAAPRATAEELATLSQGLVMPVAGVSAAQLVDSFDDARGSRRHDALDILAPRGTPVLSAADGRLLRMTSSANGGLMVYATDASERFILMYAHLDRYASGLAEGMVLRRGDRLGDVGTTGNAPPNTPHLHFAISRAGTVKEWWKGTPVNPLPLLRPSTP
jgi:peptidoglycan LD-endopeptidase LytH